MNLNKLKTLRDQVANTPEDEFSMAAFDTCIVGVAIRNSSQFRFDNNLYVEDVNNRLEWDEIAAFSAILECHYGEAEMIIFARDSQFDWCAMTHQDAIDFLDELIVEYSNETA